MFRADIIKVIDGLKLGLALQVGAIGPICLILFQIATIIPISYVLTAVLGVLAADFIYIALAVFGITSLENYIKKHEQIFKIIIGLVIILIGFLFISLILKDIHSAQIIDKFTYKNVFVSFFFLTLLNPVTIICFMGIFSSQVIKYDLNKKQLVLFATGTLLATPIFLSIVGLLGNLGFGILPPVIIKLLNLIIGLILIYLGTTCFFHKKVCEKI